MDQSEYKGLQSYEHRLGDTITGYKFQCVELARRYLVANRGVVFDSIPMAYDICACRVAYLVVGPPDSTSRPLYPLQST